MRQVLLVEDSAMFGRLTKKKIELEFDVPVYWTKTLAETEKVLDMAGGDFSMALLDFNLPDAPQGEVIDRVVAEGITSLVFTANMTEEVRSFVWSKKVADYILKEDPNSLDYIISTMRQIEKNQETLVLVIDDSPTYRNLISELLYIRKFRVITAKDGKSGLELLEQYPEIQLVIVDYNMPGMDGCLVCQKIRTKLKPDRLAIIGNSSENDVSIGARFIKNGANDFIVKHSFQVEEFYCRVNHCLETIHLIGQIRESAIRDFLTGLYNRRHFFDAGTELLKRCQTNGESLACAMFDIDYFKKVNDTYGHDIGDEVLKAFSALIRSSVNDNDLLARIGGEEFCLLLPVRSRTDVVAEMEQLRIRIETAQMASCAEEENLTVTCSIGVCLTIGESIEKMMKVADENLYTAKKTGRNRVVY